MNKPPIAWIKFSLKVMALAIAGYYIAHVSINNLSALKSLQTPNMTAMLITLITVALMYGVLMVLLALGWLAINHGHQPNTLISIYLKSIALKYLPGNFFHFVYRHSETIKTGLRHAQVMAATIKETLSLVMWSGLSLMLLLIWPAHMQSLIPWLPIALLWLGLVVAVGVAAYYLYTVWSINQYLKVMACHAVYFLGMGLICFMTFKALGFDGLSLPFITGLYALAWLAGYSIPGAPGGLGVREAVFIFVGTPMIQAHEALVLMALIRLISVATETVIYLLADVLTIGLSRLGLWSDKTVS